VDENRVLRRIFRLKKEEVAGGCRRLHSEELHHYQIKDDGMGGACSWNGKNLEMRTDILVGKLEWKRPLGKPGSRREHNIRMGFREIRWEGVECIHLAQDRGQWWVLLNTVMNIPVP
jgi:hypothetical protein